jgi:hypothetical protein
VPENFANIQGSTRTGASRFDAKMVKLWACGSQFAAALVLDNENNLERFNYSRSREHEFVPIDFTVI